MEHDQFHDPLDVIMSEAFAKLDNLTTLQSFVQQYCTKALPPLKRAAEYPTELLDGVAMTLSLMPELGNEGRIKRTNDILEAYYQLMVNDANPLLYVAAGGRKPVEALRQAIIERLGAKYRDPKDYRRAVHYGYDLPEDSGFNTPLAIDGISSVKNYQRLLEALRYTTFDGPLADEVYITYDIDTLIRCPNFNTVMLYPPEYFLRIYRMVYLKLLVSTGQLDEAAIGKVYGTTLVNHLFRRHLSIERFAADARSWVLSPLMDIAKRYGLNAGMNKIQTGFQNLGVDSFVPVYHINNYNDPYHPQAGIQWHKKLNLSAIPFLYIDGYIDGISNRVVEACKAAGHGVTYQFDAVKDNPALMYNYLHGLNPDLLSGLEAKTLPIIKGFDATTVGIMEQYLCSPYSQVMDKGSALNQMLMSLNRVVKELLRPRGDMNAKRAKMAEIAAEFMASHPKFSIASSTAPMSIKAMGSNARELMMGGIANPASLHETFIHTFDLYQFYHLMVNFESLMERVEEKDKEYVVSAGHALEKLGMLYNVSYWIAVARKTLVLKVEASVLKIDVDVLA